MLTVQYDQPRTADEKSHCCRERAVQPGTKLPKAFYVFVWHPQYEEDLALHIPFVREKDALAAKAALEKAGMDNPEALINAGLREYERVMIEALAW